MEPLDSIGPKRAHGTVLGLSTGGQERRRTTPILFIEGSSSTPDALLEFALAIAAGLLGELLDRVAPDRA